MGAKVAFSSSLFGTISICSSICVRANWAPKLPKASLIHFSCFIYRSTKCTGGYYTIEQKKSRLRIIALNTNYMRQHDNKHSYSRSAAVRQRPAYGDSAEYNNYHYHHNNHYRSNGGSNTINGYYTSGGMPTDNGGTASALSGAEHHESEKQWTWLEAVLAKSKQNKETVSLILKCCKSALCQFAR